VDDRRQNDRLDASDVGLRVVDGIDDAALGIIGNLSPGGMMLITTRELYAGGILQLRIETPREVGGSPISLGMKVLWCSPASSPNEYWAGLETIDIAAADHDALKRLLDHLADGQ
jgi:hypothetical protein